MRTQLLEARVLQVVDLVLRGENMEDSRVELKAVWPSDHGKAARQIAGLANAGSGDEVIWVIGVDEKAHQLKEVEPTELQNWWLATSKRFSEVAPELQSLVIPTPDGPVVVALAFDTSRAPYLVTTDGRGGVEREVPWREGNSTRSARRSEILRTVVDQSKTPQLELVKAAVEFGIDRFHPDGWGAQRDDPAGVLERVSVTGYAVLFVEALGRAFLPEHRWSARLAFLDLDEQLVMSVSGPRAFTNPNGVGGFNSEPRGAIEYIPQSGISISGSDTMTARFQSNFGIDLRRTLEGLQQATLNLVFPVAPTRRSVSISLSVVPAPVRPVDDRGIGNHGFFVMTHDGRESD